MTIFDRRRFFSAAMAAAGFTATRSWCTAWFLPQDPDGTARERQLRAAVAKARAEGKPLLVFVVPGDGTGEDRAAQNEAALRGRWFGAFLNHGGSRALTELALCVPACGRIDEVRRVTGAKAIDGAPLLLLVDATGIGVEDAAPPKVTRLDLDLGSPFGQHGRSEDYDPAADERRVEAGIEKLTKGLHQIVHQHGDSMAAMAAAVTSRLSSAQAQTLAAWFGGGAAPPDELLVRCAAEVRRAIADQTDERRAALQQSLVDAVEREIVHKPVPGARWYTSGGCGSEPEEKTAEEKQNGRMIACGMGMVPTHCERFLQLFTGQ